MRDRFETLLDNCLLAGPPEPPLLPRICGVQEQEEKKEQHDQQEEHEEKEQEEEKRGGILRKKYGRN